MGIDTVVFFRLPSGLTPSKLEPLGFRERDRSWTHKKVSGSFRWGRTKPNATLRWNTYLRFFDLRHQDTQQAVFDEVKLLGRLLGATAVACLPDTSPRATPSDFVPFTGLTRTKLLGGAESAVEAVPREALAFMGLDDDEDND